ncbi:hypothetical protein LAG90_15905 [Marinilongibacter aquaticus]|uniref:hypothetical protein n=1 Tax=Marinilongibacter aquaticus TaxID=2975157 RepID=UPI0021BD85E8|nr:hypothetical protein [Marinilongibacter aquaticus]UBM58289.1 hypothetical protein LAG90_15905 [Marinilongibacter aquaticus]
MSIIQAVYKTSVVFYTAVTDSLCNSAFSAKLYNCQGDIIKMYGPEDRADFEKEVTYNKVLYRCKSE